MIIIIILLIMMAITLTLNDDNIDNTKHIEP